MPEETVDLIASGYEWTCPYCDELNKEIGILKEVICPWCEGIFIVSETNHAYE